MTEHVEQPAEEQPVVPPPAEPPVEQPMPEEDLMPEDELTPEEELARRYEELELSLLQALLEKGPALPVELAVRTYMLPDEISEPLRHLEGNGYIARQRMKRGEMYVLTKEGYYFAQRSLGKETY